MSHPLDNRPAEVVLIAGSPAYPSRSTATLERVQGFLQEDGLRAHLLTVRYLPAEALLHGDAEQAEISAAVRRITAASAIVVATPVYKASYAGTLKTLLDLLPQNAFVDKPILPIATGGSPGHLLAIDYALKPVLSALGARHIQAGVYLTDAQVAREASGAYRIEESAENRLRAAAKELARWISLLEPLNEETPPSLSPRQPEFATPPVSLG